MRATIYLIFLSATLLSCSPQVEIQDIDKCQLRSTLKDDILQLSLNLMIELSEKNLIINFAQIDIEVNDIYLGSSVIAAETSPILENRYSLPVRVTFLKSTYKISDVNKILVDGHLEINGKTHPIQFQKDDVQISNYINIDYSTSEQL